MTETEPTTEETTQTSEIEVAADTAHCRHCGHVHEEPLTISADADWLCPHCDRWQNTVKCPTCNQPVHVSQLAEDQVPAAHGPVRRRRNA